MTVFEIHELEEIRISYHKELLVFILIYTFCLLILILTLTLKIVLFS